MAKSVWLIGPTLVSTIFAASSCSEDSEPDGIGGAGGSNTQGGTGAVGGVKNTGGRSVTVASAGATSGVGVSSGGTSSGGGNSDLATSTTFGGSSGQLGQSSLGGAQGGTVANGGALFTGGQPMAEAGRGGTVFESAGATGVAGAAAGMAGTAGTSAAEDPRCTGAVASATVTAHLKITADNECDVHVNGQAVGQTSSWSSAVTIDVSLYVHPGRKNVVAVVGRNTSSQSGNDRGIIGELTTTVGTNITPILVTNRDWVVSQSPGSDWTSLDYDASTWSPATEVANSGDAPWGNVLGASSEAKWIWFAPIPTSTSDKPNLEATYSRRVFYFDFDGHVADTPSCQNPVR